MRVAYRSFLFFLTEGLEGEAAVNLLSTLWLIYSCFFSLSIDFFALLWYTYKCRWSRCCMKIQKYRLCGRDERLVASHLLFLFWFFLFSSYLLTFEKSCDKITIGNDRFHFFEILADASFWSDGTVVTFSFFSKNFCFARSPYTFAFKHSNIVR